MATQTDSTTKDPKSKAKEQEEVTANNEPAAEPEVITQDPGKITTENIEDMVEPLEEPTTDADIVQPEEDVENMDNKLPVIAPEQEAKEAVEAIAVDLNDENPDKVEEYFTTKRVIKELRAELKEFKENHEEYLEADKLSKKLKLMRDKINNQTEVRILSEKIATLSERMELLKEIIKVQLIELEQEEIKHEGRKLKLVKVLKEMRDGEEA